MANPRPKKNVPTTETKIGTSASSITDSNKTPMITSIPQNVGSIQASVGIPKVSEEDLKGFVDTLYDVTFSEDELNEIYEQIRYKGFVRSEVLKQLAGFKLDKRIMTELVMVCSLQGPQRASTTKLSNGRSPIEMNIPASGGQGKLVLTCAKISAATADLAAYYMKKLNVPKRLNIECPAWLQFPSAAAIRMPEGHRRMHIEFARAFSPLIQGTFNEQIYNTAVSNSYINENLHLFE
jgi:hypothetical protein